MATSKKLTKDERRAAAVKIGVQIARKIGAEWVSMAMIATKQGVSTPLLFHIFGTKLALVKDINKLAKSQGVTLPKGMPDPNGSKKMETKRVRSIKEVKAIKNKVAAKKAAPIKIATPPLAALLRSKSDGPAPRKPLTPAQKKAKAVKDAARRAVPKATTPAEKFKSLPPPFEAAMSQLPN